MVLGDPLAVTLQFKDICFSVDVKKDGKKSEKKILTNINGVVHPGQTCVIMGPTGGGKTSFLDAVAGRIGSGHVSGDVLINGEPRNKYFKRFSSYVQQFDALPPMLTVQEVLEYATLLTLPSTVTKDERKEIIDDVIEELGLESVKQSRIGGGIFVGISAGQKKRVSIAIELVSSPSLIFLDEPTTGQDAAAAYGIMQLITALGKKNRTVLATIHQPSFAMWDLFDQLLLLSVGRLVYLGPANESPKFFDSVGYPVPIKVNPADHYMDIVNVDYIHEKGSIDVDSIVKTFRDSNMYKAILDTKVNVDITRKQKYTSEFASGFVHQTFSLTKRTFLNAIRNPFIYWARIGAFTGLAVMMGTMYWDTPRITSSIRDIISVIFFVAAFFSFMNIAAVPSYIEDREIFVRERSNGTFRVISYVLVHSLVSIPFLFIISLCASSPLYWMVQLNSSVTRFGYFVIALATLLYTSESLMLALSAILPQAIVVIAAVSGIMSIFMLCCGFFISPASIPAFWKFFYWISMHTYSFNGFMYNEFAGQTFAAKNTNEPPLSGTLFLKQSFNIESDERFFDIMILLGIALVFRIIYFFLLYKFQTGKK